ncbi:MAG TPA: hypothetical protein VNA15_06850 [Candidatus Angelobacter sp.]|nr:hypothetical protein [Candidatus Angelobacter sp.]
MVLGEGKRLFESSVPPRGLTLAETRSTSKASSSPTPTALPVRSKPSRSDDDDDDDDVNVFLQAFWDRIKREAGWNAPPSYVSSIISELFFRCG